jgi:hypothetical protein
MQLKSPDGETVPREAAFTADRIRASNLTFRATLSSNSCTFIRHPARKELINGYDHPQAGKL